MKDVPQSQSGTQVEAKPASPASSSASNETPARAAVDIAAISGAVEALLFSASKPLAGSVIADAVSAAAVADGGVVSAGDIDLAVDALNERYASGHHAFRIERIAGGFRVMTMPEHAEVLAKFHQSRASSKLSRAAIETAAIIAYQQPITRARLESVRGVACGEVLRSLLEKRLVAIVGRAEELGRPMLYGTTRRFLDVFGLASIKDLPESGVENNAPRASSDDTKPTAEPIRTEPV